MPSTRPGVSAPTWAVATLQRLGAPVTGTSIWALDLWSQSEGTTGNGGVDNCTGQPRYNWLNSTLPYSGSSNCCSCTQGDIQDYPNLQTGVAATAATIEGWPPIVAAFKAGSNLQTIFNAINTSAPGPCAEAGCAGSGNPTYPASMYAALGSPAPSYSVSSEQLSAGQTVASEGPQTGCSTKGQIIPNVSLLGATIFPGFNHCQLKALLGGLGIVGGSFIMLAGGALLVVSGLAGKGGPAQPLVSAALPVARKAQSVAAAPRLRRESRERTANAQSRDRARTVASERRAASSIRPKAELTPVQEGPSTRPGRQSPSTSKTATNAEIQAQNRKAAARAKRSPGFASD